MLAIVARIINVFMWPALVILAVNLERLAEDKGWDQLLAEQYPKLATLLELLQSPWLLYPAFFILGYAVANCARSRVLHEERTPPTERTCLKLACPRNQQPQELLNENVWRWFVFGFEGKNADEQKTFCVLIFIVFDREMINAYSRAVCSNASIRLNIIEYTQRSAIISAEGDLSDSLIDIQLSSSRL